MKAEVVELDAEKRAAIRYSCPTVIPPKLFTFLRTTKILKIFKCT